MKLAKSNGRTKIPQKPFTTFPPGPQLKSLWKSPKVARKMHYRCNRTAEILQNDDPDANLVWDDILSGSDYLRLVECGEIKDNNVVLMLSVDGAQLVRN